MSNVIRKIVGVIALSAYSLFIGCEGGSLYDPLTFKLETRLSKDSNGYYHMNINDNSEQTLHRISGRVTRNGIPVDVIKFVWSSDTHWNMGEWEIPIVNSSSYSNSDGEVNTMVAAVVSMRGDTATIYYGYHDNWTYEDTFGEFKIIFN